MMPLNEIINDAFADRLVANRRRSSAAAQANPENDWRREATYPRAWGPAPGIIRLVFNEAPASRFSTAAISFRGSPGQIQLRKRASGPLQMDDFGQIARHPGRRDNLLNALGLYGPNPAFLNCTVTACSNSPSILSTEASSRDRDLWGRSRPTSDFSPETRFPDSRR